MQAVHRPKSKRLKSVYRITSNPSWITELLRGEAMDESLMCYELEADRYYGVVCTTQIAAQIVMEYECTRITLTDLDNQTMRVYEENEWRELTHYEGQIELNANGERWEGGLKDGVMNGYGMIVDTEGRKVFEGFMMDGFKVCYGVEYYENGSTKYIGCYFNNRRFGSGILYDECGDVVYAGLWKDGDPANGEFDDKVVDSQTMTMVVPGESLNGAMFIRLNQSLYSLREIIIGDESLNNIQLFELIGLNELENVIIGENSCRGSHQNALPTKCTCRIVNCLHLTDIQIGNGSFSNCHSLELESLPMLHRLDLGADCFVNAAAFYLKSGYLGDD